MFEPRNAASIFMIEHVAVFPRPRIAEPLVMHDEAEPLEKRGRANNTLVFDIVLAENCTITGAYLSGLNVPPFTEFSIYYPLAASVADNQTEEQLARVTAVDVENVVIYSFPAAKQHGYRKMTNPGVAGCTYHSLIIPKQIVQQPDEFFHLHIQWNLPKEKIPETIRDYLNMRSWADDSRESFIRWTLTRKRLRIEIEMPDQQGVGENHKLWIVIAHNLPSHLVPSPIPIWEMP